MCPVMFFEFLTYLFLYVMNLCMQYTEAHLYNQLTQFYRLLDVSRVLEKVICFVSTEFQSESVYENNGGIFRFLILGTYLFCDVMFLNVESLTTDVKSCGLRFRSWTPGREWPLSRSWLLCVPLQIWLC